MRGLLRAPTIFYRASIRSQNGRLSKGEKSQKRCEPSVSLAVIEWSGENCVSNRIGNLKKLNASFVGFHHSFVETPTALFTWPPLLFKYALPSSNSLIFSEEPYLTVCGDRFFYSNKQEKPKWQLESSVNSCTGCSQAFSTLVKKVRSGTI